MILTFLMQRRESQDDLNFKMFKWDGPQIRAQHTKNPKNYLMRNKAKFKVKGQFQGQV